jgi:NitT/TauT family transport system permease protein
MTKLDPATSSVADDKITRPADEELLFSVDPSIRQRRRERITVVVSRVLVAVVFLGFWQFASGRLMSDYWISNPISVGAAFVGLWNDGLLAAIGVTLIETLVGFLLGAVAGILFGIVLGANRVIAKVADPYLVGFSSLPRVALIPLLIVWFGVGFETKVIFTALLVFFPIFLNTLSGARSADGDLIDVLRVMGASRWDTVRKVLIPTSLSWVFAGLRISVPFALIGAVVAEMFTSNQGLGHLISATANAFDTAGNMAVLLVTTVLGMLMTGGIALLERRVLRWQPELAIN